MIYDINPTFFTNDCIYSENKNMIDKLNKIKQEYNSLYK